MNQGIVTRLLVSSGNGPAECRLAVAHVLRQMEHEATEMGLHWRVTLLEQSKAVDPPSAIVMVSGRCRFEFERRWCGTVQWIAQSPFRKNHRRRNWFVGVFVLGVDEGLITDLRHQDLSFETFRAGGPGGQHQNTTDSAVRVTHLPTRISVVSKDERSQHRNRQIACERLVNRLFLMQEERDASARSRENKLHNKLQRGNPVRRFTGARFVEK